MFRVWFLIFSYHGCRKCFPERDDSRENRLFWTNYKLNTLRQIAIGGTKASAYEPFHLVHSWEHSFDEQCRENKQLGNYVKKYKNSILSTGLSLRSSLRGGRCEIFKYQVEAKEGEKIMVYDAVSLFPAMQASAQFPHGHPEIFLGIESTEHFGDMGTAILEDRFYGVLSCELYPPPTADFPAIPTICNDRLYFHLCTFSSCFPIFPRHYKAH